MNSQKKKREKEKERTRGFSRGPRGQKKATPQARPSDREKKEKKQKSTQPNRRIKNTCPPAPRHVSLIHEPEGTAPSPPSLPPPPRPSGSRHVSLGKEKGQKAVAAFHGKRTRRLTWRIGKSLANPPGKRVSLALCPR